MACGERHSKDYVSLRRAGGAQENWFVVLITSSSRCRGSCKMIRLDFVAVALRREFSQIAPFDLFSRIRGDVDHKSGIHVN